MDRLQDRLPNALPAASRRRALRIRSASWSLPSVLVVVLCHVFVSPDAATAQGTTPGQAIEPEAVTEIRSLIKAAEYEQAESAARDLLAKSKPIGREPPLEAGLAMMLLAEISWRCGNVEGEEPMELARDSIRILGRHLGPGKELVAEAMRNLGVLHEYAGDLTQARRTYEEVLALRLELHGRQDPRTADSLNDLGVLDQQEGKYESAIARYAEVYEIRSSVFGPMSIETAKALHNLALAHHEVGKYEIAAEHYLEALKIKEDLLGPTDLDVAWTCNGLAITLMELGRYGDARANYERALQIRRKALGPRDVQVAWILNNLANLDEIIGNYREARASFESALSIEIEQLGEADPDVAMTSTNLARLLWKIGDYSKSRELYEKALANRVEALGKDHPHVAGTHRQFAELLMDMKLYEQARRHYGEALRIWSSTLDPSHPDLVACRTGLARLHLLQGDRVKARQLLDESAKDLKAFLGEKHQTLAGILSLLGKVSQSEGDLARAQGEFSEAVSIAEASLGSEHPLVAEYRESLATALALSGKDEEALAQALASEAIARDHLLLTVTTLPERQALRYAGSRSSALDLALSLVTQEKMASSVEKVWDAVVKSRAIVLDEMGRRRQRILDKADPSVLTLAGELRATREELARTRIRGPEPADSGAFRLTLKKLSGEKERLEMELAQRSVMFKHTLLEQKIGFQEMQGSLPEDSALVAFVRYRDVMPRGAGRTDPERPVSEGRLAGAVEGEGDQEAYAAFVMRKGESRPRVLKLGSAEEIDDLIARWRQEVTAPAQSRRPDAEALEAYVRAGARLRERLWDPPARYLGGVKLVLVVPAGRIHSVSLASLPEGKGAFLVESEKAIHRLSAERDLVRRPEKSVEGSGLLVIGGPAFDKSPAPSDAGEESGSGRAGTRGGAGTPAAFRGSRAACGDMRNLRFASLPESRREAEEVASLWRRAASQATAQAGHGSASLVPGDGEVVRLVDEQAGEGRFKVAAPGKRVLHLATHGFFLGEGCPSITGSAERGIGQVSPRVDRDIEDLDGENPLLLSGLALAGANHRTAAVEDSEDGIVTSEEIAALNLEGVEWAVLSACDTGLGSLEPGEGVLGLQRAFRIAGVRTLIMSLWPVEDAAARDWMRPLYEARWARDTITAQAMREAAMSALESRRAHGESTHPYYWGAFVAAGDWR